MSSSLITEYLQLFWLIFFSFQVRRTISDFGVLISIFCMVAIDMFMGLDTPKLIVPSEFKVCISRTDEQFRHLELVQGLLYQRRIQFKTPYINVRFNPKPLISTQDFVHGLLYQRRIQSKCFYINVRFNPQPFISTQNVNKGSYINVGFCTKSLISTYNVEKGYHIKEGSS